MDGEFWEEVRKIDQLLFPVLLAVQELQADDAYAYRWGRIVLNLSAALTRIPANELPKGHTPATVKAAVDARMAFMSNPAYSMASLLEPSCQPVATAVWKNVLLAFTTVYFGAADSAAKTEFTLSFAELNTQRATVFKQALYAEGMDGARFWTSLVSDGDAVLYPLRRVARVLLTMVVNSARIERQFKSMKSILTLARNRLSSSKVGNW